MSCKPFIGLNLDFRTATGEAPAFSYIASGYYDCVSHVGGIPLLIPPLAEDDDLNEVLDRVDGVILVGGADLDPRRDGYMLHPSVKMMARRREDFDRRLVRMVAERRLPCFGIGAGMQLLNVSQGGNLFLHIPEDLPKAIPHRDPIDRNHRHSLTIVPDSIMDRVFGEGEIRVNSMHHMAVDEVASGFRVTARCPDGVIECIESEMDDWFALGTQFHPEAESASALDIRIFEEFMDGVRARMRTALRLIA
jgi:putative glutamine amidotransferase